MFVHKTLDRQVPFRILMLKAVDDLFSNLHLKGFGDEVFEKAKMCIGSAIQTLQPNFLFPKRNK